MATTFAMTSNYGDIELGEQGDTIGLDEYAPINESPLNIKEEMTLSPMFTPDNALDVHVAWLRKANTTIEVQNQYIRKFVDDTEFSSPDDSPIVKELVEAANRGVSVRVQIRENEDSDAAGPYLNGFANIEVRYMGNKNSSTDQNWLSDTHNKLVIIDGKVVLISSINYSENSFMNNREAGMVVQSTSVANYFLTFFEDDWADGETSVQPASPYLTTQSAINSVPTLELNQGDSFTNIPRTNFSGTYNVSAFVNPDNADAHIFKYLASAKESIYVSMYTISKQEFVDLLVNLKKNNPALDIQVLISRRRIGGDENTATQAAALELSENLIPVYNSTDQLNLYHNKYWIIDQKHTFVYSGNWSPRSVTTPEADGDWPSGDANRDMGIAVHDAPDVANFFKTEVWDKDVEVAVPYELPVGVSQTSFEQSEVVSGTVSLSGAISNLNETIVSYQFGTSSESNVQLTNDAFSNSFDTTTLDNGITTFTVTAVDGNGATYTDSVKVNIANYPSTDNFRLLITEIHANPDVVDDTEGEFIELTNSFPFALLVENWQIGDNNDLYTFGQGYEIPAYTSIIIARDATGFTNGFNLEADIITNFALVNTKDYVQLLNQAGEYVDVVAYGDIEAPDGSESVSSDFDAGQSISRVLLHYDSNRASDFTFAEPSPKANVPQVKLGDTSVPTTGLDGLPYPMIGIFVILAIPILRRKRQ